MTWDPTHHTGSLKPAETKQDTADMFRIASMTKPVTVVAAMILFEEGKFQLGDPQKEIIAILLLQLYPFEDWKMQEEFERVIYEWM